MADGASWCGHRSRRDFRTLRFLMGITVVGAGASALLGGRGRALKRAIGGFEFSQVGTPGTRAAPLRRTPAQRTSG
ncbi:MAG: hypothetical protein ACLTDR_08520 [Adlercreutzia equolifaciens]